MNIIEDIKDIRVRAEKIKQYATSENYSHIAQHMVGHMSLLEFVRLLFMQRTDIDYLLFAYDELHSAYQDQHKEIRRLRGIEKKFDEYLENDYPEKIEVLREENGRLKMKKLVCDCTGCSYAPAMITRRRCQECVRGFAVDNYEAEGKE